MTTAPTAYPVRFDVDYPAAVDRLTALVRVVLAIPVLVVSSMLGSVTTGPLMVLLLFRLKYPRWWYDWNVALSQFNARIGAYVLLLRDEYPSTDEQQGVHLAIDYPAVGSLNRWLPLVKWALAIPHYVVLAALWAVAFLAVLAAWVAILVTGHYPRPLFDFVVGVGRWTNRVLGYVTLLVTDRYPPFSLS